MKTLILAFAALTGLSVVALDAEAARRFGGGKSSGMQRSAPATPQKAAPQQQQQAAPATPPAQQPSGLQRWLGPLAGLALGAGLAALFFNNGVTGLLMGLLLLAAIVAIVFFAARAFMRGRTAERPLQYAGMPGGLEQQPPAAGLPGGAGAQSVAAATGTAAGAPWPQDFNAAEFVRHARLNFVRLQEAYDKKDLSLIRDFVTPELYREIEADVRAADDAPRQTEVVMLQGDVIDVAEEGGSYVVSVRFSGQIREAGGEPEAFTETWHLVKPLAGRSGWLVAGIQQS